jgi:hypothetical protein
MVQKSNYKPFQSFYDEIFCSTFYFLVSDAKTYQQACLKHFKKKEKTFGMSGRFTAWVCENGEQVPTMWIEKWDDEIIIHECIHAATWLLTDRGVDYKDDNDETLAYYVTWLFKKIKENYAKGRQGRLRKRQKSVKDIQEGLEINKQIQP